MKEKADINDNWHRELAWEAIDAGLVFGVGLISAVIENFEYNGIGCTREMAETLVNDYWEAAPPYDGKEWQN